MEKTYYSTQESSSNFSMTKVFGWMFFAILLTAVTALGLPCLLIAIGQTELYYPIIIGGAIAVLVLSFVSQMVIMNTKSKGLAITMFSLFAIAMGTWISPLVLMYNLETITYALLITSGVFGIMALYGAITKRDLSGFGSFLFMLLIGALLVSVVNFFLANETIDWIISYVTLGIYIGFVAFDVQRVKRLAEARMLNTNISLIMALNLYIDFVYIFIRILAIVGKHRD